MSNVQLDDQLAVAYQAAIQIMRDKSKSFYHAFSRLPENRFLAVAALYAFCRYCDDIVDQTTDEKSDQDKIEQLETLKAGLTELYAQGQTTEASIKTLKWWPAFVDSVEMFNIPQEPLFMQIKGQEMDNEFEDIESLPELIYYSEQVAGSVGRMLLPILVTDASVLKDNEFIQACESLGVAMQITNILRDVGEDIRQRCRIYLPKDLLEKHQVGRETLVELAHTDANAKELPIPAGFEALWEELAKVSTDLYTEFLPFLSYFIPESRVPLVTAALNYHAIEDEVRKVRYNCFTRRNYTSELTRGKLLLQARKIVKQAEIVKGD